MACITKKENLNGSISYNVHIKKKKRGEQIFKTFYNLEDAKLFEYYKERLLVNIDNFEVPMTELLRVIDILEIKRKASEKSVTKKWTSHMKSGGEKITKAIIHLKGKECFFHELNYEDWLAIAKYIFTIPTYIGFDSTKNKRQMGMKTLRNVFAYLSSAISHCQSIGINIENHALQVIRCFITPMMKQGPRAVESDLD